MQRDQADQELTLKKRARRRLVGAIALVLLMIVVLPMLLKDRAASNPQDKITITLPNEAGVTVKPATPSAPVEFDSNIAPVEPAITAEANAAVSKPAGSNSAENTKATLPQTITEPKHSETLVTPLVGVAAQVESDTVVNETAKPNPENMHKFYVQIGVFSDAGNVKQLQTKLTDLGYQSQTEKISTVKGEKIRLKTQKFADRNEAAIALENIKDAGLTGMVVSQ